MRATTVISLALGASFTGIVALAQQKLPQPALPVRGPVLEVQVGRGTSTSTPRVIYGNTILAGYFTAAGVGEELIDHGAIAAADDHDTVTEVELGYATYSSTTVELRFRVYPGYTGFCGFRGPPALDITLAGLPGGGSPGAAASTILSVDLNALGECFFLEEGPFGYSFAFADSISGPLFSWRGTGNQNRFDWTPSTGSMAGSCGSWWFGGWPWAGFHTGLRAHDGNDTFSGGCGGPLTLDITGATCSGNTVSIEIDGASGGDWWAVAVGTSIGAGNGGSIGGCPIDVLPVIPIRIMGQLPTQPLILPATITFASGLAVGLQVITENPTSGIFDSSNTEIINVP